MQRDNLDGAAVEHLVTASLGDPQGTALDATAGKMYWTEVGAQKIQRGTWTEPRWRP